MVARNDATMKRVCQALVDQVQELIPVDELKATAQLPPSTARDRVGQVLFLLTDALQTLSCPTNSRPVSLDDHLTSRFHAETTVRELVRTVVGADTAETLAPQASRLLMDLRAELLPGQLPATVDSLFGTVRLVDYLRGVLIEAVVCALRFRCSTLEAALTESSRALASVLATRHPGSTIELRVPPATAVQLGALGRGPEHTRGTPPNVVEMDPLTFVSLATGLREWSAELAAHRVSASGSQVDVLPGMLPVTNLLR